VVVWNIFTRFGLFNQDKSGNPVVHAFWARWCWSESFISRHLGRLVLKNKRQKAALAAWYLEWYSLRLPPRRLEAVGRQRVHRVAGFNKRQKKTQINVKSKRHFMVNELFQCLSQVCAL
jgi:hypothetical protein